MGKTKVGDEFIMEYIDQAERVGIFRTKGWIAFKPAVFTAAVFKRIQVLVRWTVNAAAVR